MSWDCAVWHSNSVKNKEDVYVIITSRKDVFEEFQKEVYSAEQIKQFEQELNILQPAYNQQKRKEMLEKWAVEKGCKWIKDKELRNFVFNFISIPKNLPTPLSIHDFVESTINTADLLELKEKILNYSGSAEKAFADEIIGLYKSGRKDRVLFLSLIFISENIEVNLVMNEYNKMKRENYEDFEKILKEEYRVTEKAYFQKSLQFSHPSYSESIKYILKNPGCNNIFWEVADDLLNYNENFHVRSVVAEELGKISDSRAIQPLINALNDPSSIVRDEAARSLEKIGDLQALESFIKALDDSNSVVRNRAARALGKISDSHAAPYLIKILEDQNSDMRSEAAEALGKIGNIKSVPSLLKALKDPSIIVQSKAVNALEEIGVLQGVQPLINTLNDPDPRVRKIVDEILERIKNFKSR